MPWTRRAIRPHAHEFLRQPARHDPERAPPEWPVRHFETFKYGETLALATHPIWLLAPLTDEARQAFSRCNVEFWAVRRPGEAEPFALVVRPDRYLHDRGFRGDIAVAEAPERVWMSKAHSTLVVARDLAFACGGGTSVEGLAWLCHALDDTDVFGNPDHDFRRRPRRQVERQPLPEEDVLHLGSLAP